MNIAQISQYPVMQKCGGFWVTVKKTKKMYQLDNNWIHSVVIVDGSGEMLADVNIGNKRQPLQRNQRLKIVVGIIQQSDKDMKLYIDEFEYETMTEPPEVMNFIGEQKTIRSKIKCWLAAAKVQAGANISEVEQFVGDPKLKRIIDSIMEG